MQLTASLAGETWSSFFNHLILFREVARLLRTSSSSCNRYLPCFNVSRRKELSMILVSASANCAPLCTHRRLIPSSIISLIERATSCVRNSAHCGGAVRVTRSKRDLQSVAATLSGRCCAWKVAVEIASGNSLRAWLGFFQGTLSSIVQAQHSFTQDNWSRTVPRETVSAAKVLVTTLWIFLHPHTKGLTGHVMFWLMFLWVLKMIQPVCELGFPFEAKEASENAKNLRSGIEMGFTVIATSECFLASCKAELAWSSVPTFALLISDWRKLNLLDKSGRVWTAAYWRLPMRALRSWRSDSLTSDSSCLRRSIGTLMGSMFLM